MKRTQEVLHVALINAGRVYSIDVWPRPRVTMVTVHFDDGKSVSIPVELPPDCDSSTLGLRIEKRERPYD